jgi:hypothetical protein
MLSLPEEFNVLYSYYHDQRGFSFAVLNLKSCYHDWREYILLALICTRWRMFEVFLMLLTCFCVFSRQTGALNRIIDRGSRAINYILTVMVFNVVPTILEVLTNYRVNVHSISFCDFVHFRNIWHLLFGLFCYLSLVILVLIYRLVWCQAYLLTSLVPLLLGLLQFQLLPI